MNGQAVLLCAALLGAGLGGACASSSETDGAVAASSTQSAGGAGGATSTAVGGGSVGGQGGTGGGAQSCAVDGALLAMDKLFLGSTDYTGVVSSTAWQNYGIDVDQTNTTSDFSAHCMPNNGANPTTAFADGPNGVDNSFGKNVLPSLLGLNPNLDTQASDAVTNGEFTLMLWLRELGPEADKSPLITRFYGGSAFPGMPQWDGSDCWPPTQEDLTDVTDIDTPRLVFDQSTLSNNEWASGTPSTIVLPISFSGFTAPVTIYQARMSMTLNGSHSGAALGNISGVIDTAEFVEVVKDVVGNVNPSLCVGTLIDNLVVQIQQASDVMVDGTQDAGATCNGISVGMGYTMLEVGMGPIAGPATPQPNPCL